jgi:hypothetical protein
LKPLFFIACGAMLLTALLWPITAIVRRRFGAPLRLESPAMRAYRLSKLASVLSVAAIAAWGGVITLMLKDLTRFSAGFDWVIHAAQLLGIVAFIGGLVMTVLNLRSVWTGPRRWPAKVWSVVLALSSCVLLWIAVVFHLIGFGVNY